MAACALLLSACGGEDKTPEGLMEALKEAGAEIDPGLEPGRYFDAVNEMCEAETADLAKMATRFNTAIDADNEESLEAMLAGMGYVCPEQGEALDRLVRAG